MAQSRDCVLKCQLAELGMASYRSPDVWWLSAQWRSYSPVADGSWSLPRAGQTPTLTASALSDYTFPSVQKPSSKKHPLTGASAVAHDIADSNTSPLILEPSDHWIKSL